MSKLGLDPKMIARGRSAAAEIAHQMDGFIRERTTVAVERTVLRLMGVDGVDIDEIPLPNRVIEAAVDAGLIEEGITRTIARAILHTDRSPQQIAEAIAEGTLSLAELPHFDEESIREVGEELAVEAADRIKRNVDARNALLARSEERPAPLHYVIVATGNIYEDAVQAKTAARQGADIVAVIRSTGQSLLDYVPYGPTTEGFGGTYATQGNFKVMREALDEVGEEFGRYIRLCNYCSGLCMPEIAAMGALERLDVMLNDALYGILFRDINPQRTFVDQYFSRMINAYAGGIINTGEDKYLLTGDHIYATHPRRADAAISADDARN